MKEKIDIIGILVFAFFISSFGIFTNTLKLSDLLTELKELQ